MLEICMARFTVSVVVSDTNTCSQVGMNDTVRMNMTIECSTHFYAGCIHSVIQSFTLTCIQLDRLALAVANVGGDFQCFAKTPLRDYIFC